MKDGAADGAPQMVFRGAYVAFLNLNHDVTPDGRRFLRPQQLEPEQAATQVNVVINWFEDVKRRASAK